MTEQVGIKVGSQNTAVARRKETGDIDTAHVKTYVRYPRGILKAGNDSPIVGDAAAGYSDAKLPLRLGVVENEEGVAQLIDILKTLSLPPEANIVLASPAVQMKDGNDRLSQAITKVCQPKMLIAFSEGLCSATYLAGVEFINKSALFSLNLGSTTLEVGCFYEGNEIYLSAHSDVCGDRVDELIITTVGNLVGDAIISKKEVREMKEGTSLLNPKTYLVEGLTRQGKKEVEVCDEIILPIKDYAEKVASIFCGEVIGSINPTVRNMALKSPLFVSGGMANLPGLPELIRDLIEKKMNHKFEISYCKDGKSHVAPAIGALLLCEAVVKEEEAAQ